MLNKVNFVFLKALEIFWINNKSIIEFDFHEYDMKNYADLGGCYPPQLVTPSSICIILHIVLSLIQ